MKRYYAKLNGSWAPKNKLHEAAQKHVEQLSGIIVDADKLEAFKSDINLKIEELNKQFPRCRPIELHTNSYTNYAFNDIYITAPEVFSMYLTEIRLSNYSLVN